MSAGRADFFPVDDSKLGRIGQSDLRVRERDIVVGDGEEGEVGPLGVGDHLREAATSAGGVGMHMNHTHTFTASRGSGKAGQAGQQGVEPDDKYEQADCEHQTSSTAAQQFSSCWRNERGCSGLSRDGGRSFA
jgi:hypothetical protein